MITDKDIAQVCADIYNSASAWDHLWTSSIYVGLKNNILCFRGSVTLDDWFCDLDALAINDPILGGVHAGFSEGIHQFFTENLQLLHKDTIVCGHSLGAARALIMAAYMEQAGIRPKAVIVFGSPLPGFMRLAEILSPVTIRSYKNRYDPVTDVPIPIYPDLPYMHPRISIPLDVEPNESGFFADHHIGLYVEGTPDTKL